MPTNDARGIAGPRRITIALIVMAIILVALGIARLMVGTSAVGWGGGRDMAFLLETRSLRLTHAVIVGVALAVSGVCLQALLRNPLAEPYTLGLSTGAGVGVAVQYFILYQLGRHFGPAHIGAILGAAASMGVVFLAGRSQGRIDPLGLLLTGVVVSTINGAFILLIQSLIGPGGLIVDLARWMMGYLIEGLAKETIALVAALTAAGFALAFSLGRAMDVSLFSDAEAESMGVNLPRLRLLLFIIPTALTGAAVVLAGPIAFVGLICPHLARSILGPTHRPLLVGSALLGASLIIAADTASALLDLRFNIGILPIGVFTAILAGPVFLKMLRPRLGRS